MSNGGWLHETLMEKRKLQDELARLRAEKAELEEQLKTVLEREAASTVRHDAKVDKLEAEVERLRLQRDEARDQFVISAMGGGADGWPDVLPCDVTVASATVLRKGVKTSTLRLALNRRAAPPHEEPKGDADGK